MNILLLLIPLSLLLLGAAIWAFSWAVRRGQFEDLDTPALDILREDASERTSALHRDADAATAANANPNPCAGAALSPGHRTDTTDTHMDCERSG